MKDANLYYLDKHLDAEADYQRKQEKKIRDMREYVAETLTQKDMFLAALQMDLGEPRYLRELFLQVNTCRLADMKYGQRNVHDYKVLGEIFMKYIVAQIEEDFLCGDMSKYGE